MKRLLLGLAMVSLLFATAAFGSASLTAPHKGMKGVDGAAVDCAYCHKTANIPKSGKDYGKYFSSRYCKGGGCH